MRVLHINAGNLYGGVETILVTLARHRDLCPQMESSFGVCFKGRLTQELQSAGAPIDDLGPVRVRDPLSVFRARRALRDLLKSEPIDIVVCHSPWSQAIFGKVVKRLGLPLVFWLHDAITGRHLLERWAHRTPPDFALCNSQFTATLLSNIYPRVPSSVLYCPVFFPSDRLSETDRALVRKELETPNEAVVIIQVGRMEKCKGHAVHLEALSLLREMKDWICWQVGGSQRPEEQRYLSELTDLASRLGISDRIRFIGQSSNVPSLLAAADIQCQPNIAPESFGLSFIEALSGSLPVVTTDIGGAKEIVDDSCGVLVPRDDVGALAASLRRLISDQPLRERLGAAGPSRARMLCNPSSQLAQLSQLLAGQLRHKVAEPLAFNLETS
jgi:glycosyltransferase involved in cell wall biosynthesis